PVDLKLVLTRAADQKEMAELALEIQEITTRDPGRVIKEVFTDTAGNAPLIGLEGKPITHAFTAKLAATGETPVDVKNVPVPARFGTYALILVSGGKRQFLATVCRVPQPRPYGKLENVPIFGEGQMFNEIELVETRAKQYARMGVRGWRSELSWNEDADGKIN